MSLEKKLEASLQSRQQRQILRSLPPPTSSNPHEDDRQLIDFTSNDYLSLTSYEPLRRRFLEKLNDSRDVLGSGGSRLLVNGAGHHELETRLATFFDSPDALLFNSGFDANVGFFTCVPQEGDVVVYDEYIHASVHDGIRASRARGEDYHGSFTHNSVESLRNVLLRFIDAMPGLKSGDSNVIVAVETLYSMDGTFAPLEDIVDLVETLFPAGNGYVVVDEAHATGLYGRDGRGLVSHFGLEKRVFARLHTFGKALGSSGAVILTSPLVKAYLLNYARSLIYTTSLSAASVVAINCSFDLLEDGTSSKLAQSLEELINYTLELLRSCLEPFPRTLVSLPETLRSPPVSRIYPNTKHLLSPIIPLMTSAPRPLSARLREKGLNARPITWPTVPKGMDRVRVCLHAGNTKEHVESLVHGIVEWATQESERCRAQSDSKIGAVPLESKL
ncbi:PLP-dependent transferase [Schizopora paradoxa]|uniref:PLP-dependent transferase n=1 Tax=Schizopora paradoxa TaxID=27342 RepID=A0A0H2S057_9AGAM|nr:PLP-dependent transferase [Schizopora paradoxa]